jgi:iduronate 2-sulfatase
MHGLANGEIRVKAGDMALFQSFDGPDTAYPDGLIAETALRELRHLAGAGRPFLLAVGFIRPHLPFGAPARYLAPYRDADLPPIPHAEKPAGRSTWHGSGEFMKYQRWGRDPRTDPAFALEVRRHYAACVSYADAQVGRMLAALRRHGLADETVVVLWGDHGWHLGEHAIWGKHALFEESLRAPLIINVPGMPEPGMATDAVIETIDIFPTLCALTGLVGPASMTGTSLVPHLQDPRTPGRVAVSYRANARTIRDASHRLVVHNDGYVELYDHRLDSGETRNVAGTEGETVARLLAELNARRPAP